ncbi:LOW QUALITY PROTEIN: zf-CCHC domain-containing protein/UBN2 domain-containing protein, partial [Cephalotus follicularis]
LLDITNALLGLGKVFRKDELVRKLLGCLNDEWEPKVTAIEESKDLKETEIEELLGSLMTHEVEQEIKHLSGEKASRRKEERHSSQKQSQRRNLRFLKKNPNKREGSKMDPPTCFECNKPGHIKVDCPQLKKKKLFKKKALKAWHLSDDDSSNEEVTEQVANLYFMASSDIEESDNEIDYSYTFGELQFAFDELLIEFKKKCSRYSSLKKNVASIENEKDLLIIENEQLKIDISILKNEVAKKDDCINNHTSCDKKDLEKEVESLKEKNVNLEKFFSKFTLGSKKLEEMLASQRPCLDKTGIGYASFEVKTKLKNDKKRP